MKAVENGDVANVAGIGATPRGVIYESAFGQANAAGAPVDHGDEERPPGGRGGGHERRDPVQQLAGARRLLIATGGAPYDGAPPLPPTPMNPPMNKAARATPRIETFTTKVGA